MMDQRTAHVSFGHGHLSASDRGTVRLRAALSPNAHDIETHQRFGTCLIARGSEVGGFDERTSVGTLMQVLGTQALPNGQTVVMAEGVECFEVARWLEMIPTRARS